MSHEPQPTRVSERPNGHATSPDADLSSEDFEIFQDCWYLTGPTASGKTAVGLELAQLLGAEIVSLDSMALYRGLDIGTAKPTLDERRRMPHHLIDILEPRHDFSVAQYVRHAAAAVRDIRARGRPALFVGGTPLYLKSLLRGIFTGPAADWALRRRLLAELQAHGATALHARLAAVDSATAARLHPNDARRVIRALEVFAATGRPISQWQAQALAARPAASGRVFALQWPRELLYARIDARVERMFAAGLVAEVEQLQSPGQGLSHTAAQAVGYREVLDYLHGARDLGSTIALVKTRTRQFAKRQLTWFRSLTECMPLTVSEPLEPAELARSILRSLQQPAKPKALDVSLRAEPKPKQKNSRFVQYKSLKDS